MPVDPGDLPAASSWETRRRVLGDLLAASSREERRRAIQTTRTWSSSGLPSFSAPVTKVGVDDLLILFFSHLKLAILGLHNNFQFNKLAAMESMLIDRTIQNQIPSVAPTKDGWISSTYGKRFDPLSGKIQFHHGVDFAGRKGSSIEAVASGLVTWSGYRYGYGNMVEINHGNGYQTRYAHHKKNLVVVGQKVDKGQVIALMGDSGRATGPHVHFEVVKNGTPINPIKYTSSK